MKKGLAFILSLSMIGNTLAIGNTTKSFTVDSKKVKEVSKNVATKVALAPVKAGWRFVKNSLKDDTVMSLLATTTALVTIGCVGFHYYKKLNNKIIEDLQNTDTIDDDTRNELLEHIYTLATNKQIGTLQHIFLEYLSEDKYKEAYEVLILTNKINKIIEDLQNTDTIDDDERNELLKHIYTLANNKQIGTLQHIFLEYLSEGNYKEAYEVLILNNKINKIIEDLQNTDTIDDDERNELLDYISTLANNNQIEELQHILFDYLSEGKYKEAYNDFILNKFNNEGIGEKIKVDLSNELLGQLDKKLENIENNYSTENSKELFEWVHQKIIKSNNIINGNGDLSKITIENFSDDKNRITKLFKTMATLSNRLGRTNDNNLHALSVEFNAINKRVRRL